MKKIESFIDKLITQLENIYPIVDLIMDNSSIYYHDLNENRRGIWIMGASLYHWNKTDEKNQIKARDKYLKFKQNFDLLSQKANPDSLYNLKEADDGMMNLINQEHAPSSTEHAKKIFRDYAKTYIDFLKLFAETESETFIIPDTNSIIQFPDPISYKDIIPTEKYVFTIPPTVIRELEFHKVFHKNQVFKKKVRSVITRLKGYRNQGNVLEGVIVNKTIIVKMIAAEPKFENSLKWLDPNNNDDKIIASILEIQIEYPSAIVILVTNDINLQNKAQLSNITTYDTDDLNKH